MCCWYSRSFLACLSWVISLAGLCMQYRFLGVFAGAGVAVLFLLLPLQSKLTSNVSGRCCNCLFWLTSCGFQVRKGNPPKKLFTTPTSASISVTAFCKGFASSSIMHGRKCFSSKPSLHLSFLRSATMTDLNLSLVRRSVELRAQEMLYVERAATLKAFNRCVCFPLFNSVSSELHSRHHLSLL